MAVDAPEPTTPTTSFAPPATTGEHDLGVLFVHGIGDQQQSATLAQFGGALQRWLSGWLEVATVSPASRHTTPTATAGAAPAAATPAEAMWDPLAPSHRTEVVAVDHHPAGQDTPAHAEVRLRIDAAASDQSWLLAEAWWAPEVTPPRFSQFVRWVVPMLPWLAAEYAVAATQTDDSADRSPNTVSGRAKRWIERWSLGGLVWLVSPVIAVALMALTLVLALLQQLPIVGKRVAGFTVNLVKGVGDAYLFAHDALQRAAMLHVIDRDLAWLRTNGCNRVAIVAHSQGAALSHDLLRSERLRPSKPVELLVTVGSGVRRLNGFRDLYDDARLRFFGWWSIFGLLALVGGALLAATTGSPSPTVWTGAAMALVGSFAAGNLGRHHWLGAAVAALGGLVVAAAGVTIGARLVVGGLLVAIGFVLYELAYVAVRNKVDDASRLALAQSGVQEWVDYYATADPVPNGPTRTWPVAEQRPGPPPVHPLPERVHNLRSVYADHSAYFDNLDEFVGKLALDLARVAKLDLGLAAVKVRHAAARRRWRTSCRSNLRNLLLLTGLGAAAMLTIRHGWAALGAAAPAAVRSAASTAVDWLAKRPALGVLDRIPRGALVGVLVVAIAAALVAFMFGWAWSVWELRDTARLLSPSRATVRSAFPAWAFHALAAVVVVGAALSMHAWAGVSWLWLAVGVGGAATFTALLTWQRWVTCLGQPTPAKAAVAEAT
jgi:hypothetical protein